jgi:hypothetical protein
VLQVASRICEGGVRCAFAKAERVVSRIEGQPHWEILVGRLLGVIEVAGPTWRLRS